MKQFLLLCSVAALFCCTPREKPSPDSLIEHTLDNEHFEIKDSAGVTIITIIEPFLSSKKVERYLLYPKGSVVPQDISATLKIGIPIERIGINSTTHLGFLNSIKKQQFITACSNSKLYYDSTFKQRIKNNELIEIGTRTLNTEKVIRANLDVLFSYAIDAASYKKSEKLRELGQPVILISEYMESDPIQKAKWLRVFAAFFDEPTVQLANQKLEQVEANYNAIKINAASYSDLPKVAIGLPWKGTWYVSGTESFQAKLINDAAGNYIWNAYKQSASVPLDIETAISKGIEAAIWINPGTLKSSKDLISGNENFSTFKSFKNAKIYSNYKRSNKYGASDYWESGVVRPDLILSDLVSIFHPTDSSKLYYYQSIFE